MDIKEYILEQITTVTLEQVEKIVGSLVGMMTFLASSFTHPTLNIVTQMNQVNGLLIESFIRASFAIFSGVGVYALSKLVDKYIFKTNAKNEKRNSGK